MLFPFYGALDNFHIIQKSDLDSYLVERLFSNYVKPNDLASTYKIE